MNSPMIRTLLILAALACASVAQAQSPTTFSTRPIIKGCTGPLKGANASQATCGALSPSDVTGLGTIVVADTTGVADAAPAINAITMAGRTAVLPCGTYKLGATVRMASGAVLDGQGCATLTASASMTANPIWGSIPGASAGARMMISNMDATGNSNITVRGVSLNGDNIPLPAHLMAFYKVTGAVVENSRCSMTTATGAIDCTAFVQSSKYRVSGNTASGMANACYDQWDGVTDFIVENNVCDGGGNLVYGVLVNGLSTANTTNDTWRGIVRSNFVKGTMDAAIWIGGLCGGSPVQCGTVNEMIVEGNVIDGGGYTAAGLQKAIRGVLVSDGVRNRVSGNIIKNLGGPGIYVYSQNATAGATDRTIVDRNHLANVAIDPTAQAISVHLQSTNTVVSGNVVDGGGYNYPIYLATGVTGTVLSCGRMTAGTSGTIANTSTGAKIDCYDNTNTLFTSPGPLWLGIAGTDGVVRMDVGGNLYPGSSGVRSLGLSTNIWSILHTKQISLARQTIATLPTCNSGAAGYSMAISDGQTTAANGYGGAVSTTGTTTRRVLCDGASWVYN